ncbi:MAG TPA: tripartite tricarboxylate transporter substrate binding protein [Burkholderiales bacterium]|jgi:tripartite-type tricarboxylate transporter receptor subunit TctC
MIRFLIVLACAVSVHAQAQTFPTRPLRVIVPQPPGGGFDMVARTLSDPFATLLGQPVVVENRPGGGTVVGTEIVAKSDPDGYTVLLGASANLVLSAGLYSKLPYDPKSDFTPVGIAATFSYTLVARNDLPFNSLKEIVQFARANPGKLTYASGGNGSGQHICAALLWHGTGASVTHVPYKGAAAAYQDLIPGRVDLFFDASSTARGHAEAGRVKPIAVSSPARLAYHPAVPTVRETGVLDFEMETWVGYFVRAGTPAPVLARLRADFERVAAMPETAAMLEKRGARPVRVSAAEAEALLARDLDKWVQLIRAAGIRAD